MYKDLENKKFDYLILGTNLTESALSAYLAKSKYKIIQADISKSYGGDCKNYNLRDMESFVKEIKDKAIKDSSLKNFSLINEEIKDDIKPILEKENYRQYNFDLNPKLIYSKSKSTTELLDSNASNYIEFNSIKQIYFMYNDKFLNTPFSKSDIFISNDLDLLEKQNLLKFIYSVMKLKNDNVDVNSTVDVKKDIELDDDFLFNELKNNLNIKAYEFLGKHFNKKLEDMILLILSNQSANNQNMTVDQMCDKIFKFLNSVQIYDKTPYLLPQYGSSEYTQAMSRLSAVHGSIFLINDLLEFNIKYNKDKKDDTCGKFIVDVVDGEKNEKFVLNVDKIIINNSYLDDTSSQVKFEEEIKNKIKNKSNDYVYKYSAFYSIKHIGQLLTNTAWPNYYRVPKNNSLINNEYQLDAIRFCNNNCVVPNNRTLFQIFIFSDINEKDENMFINKAKNIADNFINKIVKDMKEDILNNYNNEEFRKKCEFSRIKIIEEINKEEEKKKEEEEKRKKEEEENKKKEELEKKENEEKDKDKENKNEENNEEKKEEEKEKDNKNEEKKEEKNEKIAGAVYIPPKRPKTPPKKELISLNPEIIIKYELKQKVEISDYIEEGKEKENSDIIFTKNNYISIDLDEYFEESFNILKQHNLIKEEKKNEKKEEKEEKEDEEDEEDNKLIDELFDEIELDEEKEEKDENKEEITEEKKEEVKEENKEEKKEENKEENKDENKEEKK